MREEGSYFSDLFFADPRCSGMRRSSVCAPSVIGIDVLLIWRRARPELEWALWILLREVRRSLRRVWRLKAHLWSEFLERNPIYGACPTELS